MKPNFTNQTVHQVAAQGVRRAGIDPRRGWSLFWTRGVPAGSKITSLFVGVVATAILMAFEFPLEAIVATLAPIVGLVADAAIDGLEVIALPVLLACCMLSYLVKPVQPPARVD
jgi:hypothetical protein